MKRVPRGVRVKYFKRKNYATLEAHSPKKREPRLVYTMSLTPTHGERDIALAYSLCSSATVFHGIKLGTRKENETE